MTTTAPAAPRTLKIPSGLVPDLVAIVGAENVLDSREETLVYECDGYMVEKSVPDVVVFPTSTEQVVEVVKLCNRHDIPFVPRGAGTSLAGGTLTDRRRGHDLPDPDEADPRSQHPRPLRDRRVGRRQRLADAIAGRHRASTTLPTRRARGPARSAATSRPTRAARTRSSTA